MDAVGTPAPSSGPPTCACQTARRSTFEHDLVMAAIALVADGRYPKVDVVNIDAAGPIDRDLDALATAGRVAVRRLEPVEARTHGFAVRRW